MRKLVKLALVVVGLTIAEQIRERGFIIGGIIYPATLLLLYSIYGAVVAGYNKGQKLIQATMQVLAMDEPVEIEEIQEE